MAVCKRRKAVQFGAVFILVTLCASAQVGRSSAAEATECDRTSLAVAMCWHKLNAGPFSILAPSGWEFHQLQGVDSYVGEFVGDGVALKFDFGRYSSGYRKKSKESEHATTKESIGGLTAKLISPRISGHGFTGVYFRRVRGTDALCLWGKDLTATQQALVLKVFETIRFGGAVPPSVIPPPPPPPGS
jgi:hypothetical protein